MKRVELFGSAAREDFSANSDIDLLLTYYPDASHDLLDLTDMAAELESIFGHKVDIVEREAIESCDREALKKEILGSAKVIYDEAA